MHITPPSISALALFIVVLCSSLYAQPAAVLDSLTGTAEVQRAGSNTWISINRYENLYNNDVIRISKEGFAVVRWPDNSEGFAHGGSQILVNIAANSENNRILSYATVFVGSVFFVIKKMLPKKFEEDIQIYTPTTVISIRGTSFFVGVEAKTGLSAVKVVSGTVRVRCIEKNASAFISAPFKTVVAKKTATIQSSALLTADIDSLKSWIPHRVIELEVSRQLSRSKHERMVLSGILEESCHIAPFVNESGYTGNWDITGQLPRLIAEKIHTATNRLDVHFAGDSGTPAKADRFTITGTINFFDILNHAAITVSADNYVERAIGRVTLTLNLKDSRDTSETYSVTVTGERSGKKNSESSWATISGYPLDFTNEAFSASIIGSALEQALDAGAEKMIAKIYE